MPLLQAWLFFHSSHNVLGSVLCGERKHLPLETQSLLGSSGEMSVDENLVSAVAAWSGLQHLPELAWQPRSFTESCFKTFLSAEWHFEAGPEAIKAMAKIMSALRWPDYAFVCGKNKQKVMQKCDSPMSLSSSVLTASRSCLIASSTAASTRRPGKQSQ